MRPRIVRTISHKVTEFTAEQKAHYKELMELKMAKRFVMPITSITLMTDKYGTIMPTSVFYNSSQKLLKMED